MINRLTKVELIEKLKFEQRSEGIRVLTKKSSEKIIFSYKMNRKRSLIQFMFDLLKE